MNILMTLSQLEVTGAEVYAVTIANKLIEKGHKVYIISDTLTKSTKAVYISQPLSNRSFIYRIKNIKALSKFIKENNIQIVHAHSRASAWVSSFACRKCKIPLITTVHGRQATFLSRKIIKGFGNYILAVCEEIKKQLVEEFNIPENRIEVLRNGFETEVKKIPQQKSDKKVVTYITRLSGPKGELALQLLEHIENQRERFGNVHFRLVGGQEIPDKFLKFKKKFEFTGYIDNIKDYIDSSSLVIGSGRIAVESLLHGKPTIAVGEATGVGLVKKDNLDFALETNFGDMAEYERVFDFDKLLCDIETGLKEEECPSDVKKRVTEEFNINRIVVRIDYLYQSILVRFHKYEIPVIMYHRLINSIQEAGSHGIYVTMVQFENHMKYLKNKGFETIDFSEALKLNRLDKTKKYIIITFDDGYKDNYQLAFPILKKYGFKAVIFLVAGLEFNKWDYNTSSGEPKLTFMDIDQLLEMQKYGIVFGAHTLTHPDLTAITIEEAEKEIKESKSLLEKKLCKGINTFAYPYGRQNDEIKEKLLEAGYCFGIATDSGPVGLHEDILQIRRIAIFPNTNLRGFARKTKGNYNFRKIKDPLLLKTIPGFTKHQ